MTTPTVAPCIVVILVAQLAACGDGGESATRANVLSAPVDEALGGIWTGVDSSGLQIIAFSTESGRMHWVAPTTAEQGFGQGSVSGKNVSIDYTYVPAFGFALDDGSKSADCIASGTIDERTTLAVTTNCTTSIGGSFSSSATLSYYSLYDHDSSLAAIAGDYDDAGLVFTIDATGSIFEQDPAKGCVVNGQVTIIDSRYNAYDVSITYSNCIGDLDVLNGSTLSGLATLDDNSSPETAVAVLTGMIDGVTISVIIAIPRI